MKKNFIFEELVDPSSLTATFTSLDMSAIKNVKTDNQLLTDINSAAKQRNQTVSLGNSTGNSVEITKISDTGTPSIPEISALSDNAAADLNSPYNRVKYFVDILKTKGYVINWGNGKMTITKTKTDNKVTKPEIEKDDNQPKDFSSAQSVLTSILSPSVSALNLLKNKKSTKNESMVKEEINRIKQLMK